MSTSHTLALALDDFLRLTDPNHAARREVESYLGNPETPDMHPALSTLQQLRFEAEQEVERLLALMDAIDGDPDLEISAEVDGDFACDGNGFEPNFATTDAEDATGVYVQPPIPYVMGLDQAPDELEDACEDEGAQCDDEGVDTDTEAVNEDGDVLDQGEGGGEGLAAATFRARARLRFEGKQGEFLTGWHSFAPRGQPTEFYWCQPSAVMGLSDAGPWVDCFRDKATADRRGKPELCVPLAEFQRNPSINRIMPDVFDLPDEYCLLCSGNCMAPEISDRARVWMDKREPVAPGDIVVLWFRPELVDAGKRHQALIKRLVQMPTEGIGKGTYGRVLVRMNNPPRVLAFNSSDLLAVHRCMGPIPDETVAVRVSDGRRAQGQSLIYV